MILDHRCMTILTKIVHAPSHVSPQEIMEDLNVSKRTVYYDVEKINSWLKEKELEELRYVRAAGFFLSEKGKQQVRQILSSFDKKTSYEFSPKERIAWAAILILTREKAIFLQDLMDKLSVSRSTLLADIRDLKRQLAQFQIELSFHKTSGYFIAGEEQDKRKVIIYFLSQVLMNRGWNDLISEVQLTIQDQHGIPPELFQRSDVDTIYGILNESESYSGVQYTDEVMETLSAHLYLLIRRFNQGKYIKMDPVEKEVIKETKEYSAAQFICRRIGSGFRLSVPEDEACYIATYLLSAKISDYKAGEMENKELGNLKKMASRMVDDFQKYACVFFQNRIELERNLLIHLKPAYFRIKYGIEVENPLSKSMQDSYQDLFILTKKVVHHFEYVLGKSVSDDEVAYIAMHFGGWIDKEGVKVEARKKAMVVCASGIGTSRILQKQIEDLMPLVDVVNVFTVREYEKASLAGLDFVISTTPVTEKNVPVFVVNPILNPSEKETLLKQVQAAEKTPKPENIEALMSIIRKHADIKDESMLIQELKAYYQSSKEMKSEVDQKPMLNEVLTPDKIQFADSADSWQEALKKASQPLLEDKSISQGYIDAMIKNVNEMGPYIVIAPGIALPHARPEAGVNKLGMSFLQLKESCSFSEKPEHQVTLFFVLAAIDNETHLKALSQLSKMLSDGDNLEKLQSADTAAEVLAIINQYSKD
ncbi:BglG family transcriptional antiterminator [Cytobacillus oceanisediminis]|uniref:BglG family transcriptional antiterminator n=1 Tax=Cytobacillus oceanisediminis TaxID=665099 RepID=A0A2V2ZZ57_9BACI|nr:BglG family transcription antiterminator [Cytobacillus oceanisediminis]PWW29398.1 BglG family transcriptional antiterminator [Cytobacillus oceanisediminis]